MMRSMSDLGTVDGANTQTLAEARRGRMFRRLGIAVMVVFLAAGAMGWLGQHKGTASATQGGYRIEVSYPKVTRGGLPANWVLRVERLDGQPLPSSFDIRSNAGYFAIFDENGLDPQPASVWSDGAFLTWTFEPEQSQTVLVVRFDARLQPNTRGWFDNTTSLVVDDTVEVSANYRTWAVP